VTHQGSLGPDNDPQFTEVGRLVGDHIVWHDGRPPTPWPQVIPAPSSPSEEGDHSTTDEGDQ